MEEMTTIEKQVTRILERCQGREEAIPARALAQWARISEREARRIVRHLIEFHHLSVGSSTGRPCGYYMVSDADEVMTNYRKLICRGLSIMKRAAVIKKVALPEMMGQLLLEFKAEIAKEVKYGTRKKYIPEAE